MIASNNDRMQSFVGTVKHLTAEEKVVQACERRNRYLLDIATYEQSISERDTIISAQKVLLAEKENEINMLKAELDSIKNGE